MKKNPVDGGRYQRSVKYLKKSAKALGRDIEYKYKLPRGSVKICLTKLNEKHRNRLIAMYEIDAG
jgi:hypothetical protein